MNDAVLHKQEVKIGSILILSDDSRTVSDEDRFYSCARRARTATDSFPPSRYNSSFEPGFGKFWGGPTASGNRNTHGNDRRDIRQG